MTRSVPVLLTLFSLSCVSDAARSKSAAELVRAAKSRITEVDVSTAADLQHKGAVVIDVREPAEYEAGHIPGAVNIPRGVLEFRIGGVAALENLTDEQRLQSPILLYCRSGGRSSLATASLQDMGYTNVKSITGGYSAWVAAERRDPAGN